MEKFSYTRSIVLIALLTVVAGALYVFGMSVPRPELPVSPGAVSTSPKSAPNTAPTIPPQRGTLLGNFVCLPHADTTGPQTLECAYGIETDERVYYALDFLLMSAESGGGLAVGDRFLAEGIITPIEQLSTDHWRKYQVSGIFSVTNIIEKF